MSVQNAIGGLSGLIGPIITGLIVDRTGSFNAAFLVAAAVALIGLFCWAFVVGRVVAVKWSELRPPNSVGRTA